MRAWSWQERVGVVMVVLAAGVAVVQAINWLSGGVPPAGPVLVLLAWMQLSRARSHRLRRNPSRAENRTAIATAVLTVPIAVIALIRDQSTPTVVISIGLLVAAVAALVSVSLNGPPAEPDPDPRRAAPSPESP